MKNEIFTNLFKILLIDCLIFHAKSVRSTLIGVNDLIILFKYVQLIFQLFESLFNLHSRHYYFGILKPFGLHSVTSVFIEKMSEKDRMKVGKHFKIVKHPMFVNLGHWMLDLNIILARKAQNNASLSRLEAVYWTCPCLLIFCTRKRSRSKGVFEWLMHGNTKWGNLFKKKIGEANPLFFFCFFFFAGNVPFPQKIVWSFSVKICLILY